MTRFSILGGAGLRLLVPDGRSNGPRSAQVFGTPDAGGINARAHLDDVPLHDAARAHLGSRTSSTAAVENAIIVERLPHVGARLDLDTLRRAGSLQRWWWAKPPPSSSRRR